MTEKSCGLRIHNQIANQRVNNIYHDKNQYGRVYVSYWGTLKPFFAQLTYLLKWMWQKAALFSQ